MAGTFSKRKMEHFETSASDYDESVARRGQQLLEEERQMSVLATAKLHRRALLITSVAFTAGVMFGYDTVSNTASISMPSFLLTFGKMGPTGIYLPSLWTSLWTSMSALMQGIGAIIVGFIADKFGRKWPACASAAISLIVTAIQYTAHTGGSLLAGRMVSGLGIGGVYATATTYASETSPLKLRALIQAALVLWTVFMQGLALGVVRIFVPNITQQAFRNVFAIQWATRSLAAIAFALVTESPVFLVNRGEVTAARNAMLKIYGSNKSVDERLVHLVRTIQEEEQQRELQIGSYIDCFRGTNLKRTMTVVFLYSTANCGGAALLSQSIYFLIIAGLPAIHAFDVSIGGFGLAIIIIILGGMYLQKISRRTTLLARCVVNLVFMTIIGTLYYAKGTGPLWAIAVLMNVLISLQTSLLQAVGWPIAAEISSYRLRAKTLSVGILAQTGSTWLSTFTVPYMYNIDSDNLGARTGFVFAGISVLLILGAWYIVPDTANLSIEEIDHLYEQKVPVRDFQTRAKNFVMPSAAVSRKNSDQV